MIHTNVSSPTSTILMMIRRKIFQLIYMTSTSHKHNRWPVSVARAPQKAPLVRTLQWVPSKKISHCLQWLLRIKTGPFQKGASHLKFRSIYQWFQRKRNKNSILNPVSKSSQTRAVSPTRTSIFKTKLRHFKSQNKSSSLVTKRSKTRTRYRNRRRSAWSRKWTTWWRTRRLKGESLCFNHASVHRLPIYRMDWWVNARIKCRLSLRVWGRTWKRLINRILSCRKTRDKSNSEWSGGIHVRSTSISSVIY